MFLQVLVAHTGQRLRADPNTFGSLEAFKSWLREVAGIAPANQILLTGQGKQAKLQALLVEKEIFLYDRQVVAAPDRIATSNSVSSPLTDSSRIEPFPTTLSNPKDIQAWRALFKARSEWASALAADARAMADEASGHFDAFEVIERALSVAVGNLQSHVGALKQRFAEARQWSKQADRDHLDLIDSLGVALPQLGRLPAKAALARFLPWIDESAAAEGTTLSAFASRRQVDSVISVIRGVGPMVADDVDGLEEQVKDVDTQASNLVEDIENLFNQSIATLSRNTSQLMEEIDVFAKKIHTDFLHLSSTPSDPQSLSKTSKTALLHTKNHLPSLLDFHEEMRQYLEQVIYRRNTSASRTTGAMQRIAAIEASFAQVNAQVLALDVPQDSIEAVETASLMSHLPFVYGALLIEGVRRREWDDRIRGESAYLAEDIASYRDEEQRRRKKWLKSLGTFVNKDSLDGDAINFELNIKGQDSEWPALSRDDISDYLRAMRDIGALSKVVEDLSEAAKELDKPSRRQLKQAKGFKTGSMHEAGGLKASLLFRGNDDLTALREANQKLDDDLKSQKSRVRKLEDLLYKQSMASRTSSAANIFQPADAPSSADAGTSDLTAPSPKSRNSNESLSRKASINNRRLSSNRSGEDKSLARRIVSLEAELNEERTKHQQLEQAASAKKQADDSLQAEIEEARSTKKDLMANMEAQQHEFDEDRRLLKEDITRLKNKNEEMEDELDRILGSRDNERAGADTRLQAAEHELEQVRSDIGSLQDDAKARDELQDEYNRSLSAIHRTLDPKGSVPKTFAELIDSLDGLAERAVRRKNEFESAVTSIKADKDALQSDLDKQERESASLRAQMQVLDEQAVSLRDELATEKARSSSLLADLVDGRDQLRQLRNKFADGETGSEALRQRLEEQAARASALSTQLAQSKSHINSLDFELSKLQRLHQSLEKSHGALTSRLERRSARDRDMTKRLVTRNQDSLRLLESLGLSALRKDDALLIQRTSKLTNMSQSLNDAQSTANVMTASLLSAQPFEVNIDPSLTKWMFADDEEAEAALYSQFLSRLDELDTTTFSEAIIKLRRDVEWTGKKWKMEARHYRDKQHRAQSEAQGKIAFRSFKEGDLALFLPTRNQATRPWAAFNVGAPHYFLREQDSHRLKNREWLVARISKVEERVVNLSKTLDSLKATDGRSINESEGGAAIDDDNPFELSDGLRWYMLDAAEEKAGAPATPGLGKSTVASTTIDAKGSIRMKKMPAGKDASTTLNKSLESRRSSSNSKRGSISGVPLPDASDTGRQTSLMAPPGGVEGKSGTGASAARARSGSNAETGSGTPRTREEPQFQQQHPASPPSVSASLLGFLGSITASKPLAARAALRDPDRRSLSTRSNSPNRRGFTPSVSSLEVHNSPAPSPSKTVSHLRHDSQPSALRQTTPASRQPQQQQPSGSSAWESLWSLDHTVSLEDRPSR